VEIDAASDARLWVCPRAAEHPRTRKPSSVRLDPDWRSAPARIPTALCLQIYGSLPVAGEKVIRLWLRLGDS